MKTINKLIFSIAITGALLFSGCYWAFLYLVPNILNSENAQFKYNEILTNKLNLPSVISGAQIKTYPNLSFDISAKGIYIISPKNENLIKIEDMSYHSSLFNIKKGTLNTENIYADINNLKNYLPKKEENEEQKPFKIKFFPATNIKNIFIKLDDKSHIEAANIQSQKVKHNIETTLDAKIYTPYTKSPVIIGNNGKIIYGKDFSLENFSLQLNKSKLFANGDKNKLHIYGNNLPIDELEGSFLYYYKLKNPNKKNFIENFSNFKGTLDVDLDYTKDGFWGTCITNNLSALFWTRKIEVSLPKTIFNFNNRQITAKTKGTFGSEPVDTDFILDGLATKNLHIKGNVYSKFTNRIVKKYFPEVSIQGSTDASVTYTVNNGAVDVFYKLGIPKGNNLLSKYGNLDNTNTYRKLSAHTYKNGDTIYLKTFNYDIDNQNILYGDGQFEKQNGKYTPAIASVKTNGKISTAVIKSFIKNYIKNGTFDADIKYNFKTSTIDGGVNLYDISHSDFLKLNTTNINVDKNILKMKTEGTFYDSPITASFSADNNFKTGLLINDINIHLKKFILKRGMIDDIPDSIGNLKNKKIQTNSDYNIEIKQGNLYVDEIYHRQFDVTNLEIHGNLKNHIVNFVMPKANYAGGLLTAKGKYDVITHSADMEAFASDIDSNIAVTRFFRLKDQIQGIAFATAHVVTKNKLNDIKADTVFAIDDGFLPKLGSTEFIVQKSKNKNKTNNDNEKKRKFKFTLSKISNIDFSKPNIFYSNLYGSFSLDNELVKNVKIFSKSDYLSLFIEGDYNIDDEFGKLYIWGRRNKTAAKKIRILKIPINWIYKFLFRPEHTALQYKDKIKQIPEIKAGKTDEIGIFRVYVSGDLNSDNKLKVELKDLRE